MRPTALLSVPLVLIALCSCAQEAPPPPPPKPPLELIGEWGTRGDSPGQLQTPAGIGTDFAGNVYITDVGNGFIQKFDPSGKPLLSFKDPLLKSPRGIAVDDGGGIYVADFAGKQLLIFKPDGERFRRIRRSANGALREPFGVAATPSGIFYVTDSVGISRYNSYLRPLNSWGILGNSPLPKECVTAVAAGPDGNVYATDPRGAVVQRFGPAGLKGDEHTVFFADTPEGGAARAVHTAAVAVSDKFVFLLDEPSGRLLIWWLDEKLALNRAFAELGISPVPVIVSLAWSPKGELLLLDQAHARVLRFRVNL